ncbi:GNAT family N-acetyltransferase [Robertmurraya sp. FSL W8-0741]|uniref:GNAT family N-acetyltransferase n=1 Tax=Robertmurraya sp. FSL W8-0741 TaxID=2954629 RepID=UPI0030F77FE1
MKFNRKDKTLETERLQLRLFTAADAEQVRSLCDNFTIFKTTLNMPYPYSLECALSWMANHERNFTEDKLYELAITNKNNGQLYGAIALSNQRLHQNGEMAYWIGKPFWGNGYATEAARAMLEFAFEEKNYYRVYARYFKSNPASGRVLEKCGMVYEGTLKDHVYKLNTFEDLIYYGIVK